MKPSVILPIACLALFAGASQVCGQLKDTLYVDDLDPGYQEFGGPWGPGTDRLGNPHAGWGPTSREVRMDNPNNLGQKARWTPTIEKAGDYVVYFILPRTGEGRNRALYVVDTGLAPPDSMRFNQSENSGNWIFMGIYYFPQGAQGYVEVINDSVSTTGYKFKADAVRLVSCPDIRDIEPVRRNRYDFGEVSMGTSVDWVLTVYNIGGTPLTIYNVEAEPDVFSVPQPSFPQVVEPKKSVDLTVRFSPNFERTFDGVVRIHSDDPDEPLLEIPVRGSGAQVSVIVNNDDGFPYYLEHVGTWQNSNGAAVIEGLDNPTSRYSILSQNPGARAQFIPTIPVSGYYNIYMCLPATTNACNHALYEVHPFGSAVDSVYLDQNSGDNPAWWKLVGTYYLVAGDATEDKNSVYVVNDGTGSGYVLRTDLMKFTYVPTIADVELATYHHNFGEVPVNTHADWDLRINNLGTGDLIIYSMATSSPYFRVVSPTQFPVTVPALDSMKAVIRFSPDGVWPYADSVVIETDDVDEPRLVVTLEGKGRGVTLIVDDTDTLLYEEGPTDTTWHLSSSISGVNGTSRYTDKYLNPGAYARWTVIPTTTMSYEVYASCIPSQNSTHHAPYVIEVFGGLPDTILVDQSSTSADNIWVYLGTYTFYEGQATRISVVNDTTKTYLDDLPILRADAVKLSQPTAVKLEAFYVSFENGLVVLNWRVASPSGWLGFHVYRTTDDKNFPTESERITQRMLSGGTSFRFVDRNAGPGSTWYYWLKEVGTDGDSHWHGPVSAHMSTALPRVHALHQNYPNPFNPRTVVRYEVAKLSRVRIVVYDVRGRLVRTLVDGRKKPGHYGAVWDGKDDRGMPAASGVYLLRMETENFAQTRKMTLMR